MAEADWFAHVREELHEAQWFDEQERAERTQQLHDRYMQGRGSVFVPLSDTALALARAMVARLEVWGTITLGAARPGVVQREAMLCTEREQPQHILIAVHEDVPPFLWFPAGQSAAEVHEALAPYRAEAAADEFSFEGRERGFLGTEAMIEMDRAQVFEHLSMHPLAESLFWGSASERDPWPSSIETSDLPELADEAREHLSQRAGAVWSISCRAIASRAVVMIEDHEGMFVAQVRYQPAPHHDLISALSAQFRQDWPSDLPVDVVALLIGFFFERADKTRGEILSQIARDSDHEALTLDLYVLSALMHGDVRLIEDLRPMMAHPDVQIRTVVADIAIRQGFEGLFVMMASREQDADLRRELIERLEEASS